MHWFSTMLSILSMKMNIKSIHMGRLIVYSDAMTLRFFGKYVYNNYKTQVSSMLSVRLKNVFLPLVEQSVQKCREPSLVVHL